MPVHAPSTEQRAAGHQTPPRSFEVRLLQRVQAPHTGPEGAASHPGAGRLQWLPDLPGQSAELSRLPAGTAAQGPSLRIRSLPLTHPCKGPLLPTSDTTQVPVTSTRAEPGLQEPLCRLSHSQTKPVDVMQGQASCGPLMVPSCLPASRRDSEGLVVETTQEGYLYLRPAKPLPEASGWRAGQRCTPAGFTFTDALSLEDGGLPSQAGPQQHSYLEPLLSITCLGLSRTGQVQAQVLPTRCQNTSCDLAWGLLLLPQGSPRWTRPCHEVPGNSHAITTRDKVWAAEATVSSSRADGVGTVSRGKQPLALSRTWNTACVL